MFKLSSEVGDGFFVLLQLAGDTLLRLKSEKVRTTERTVSRNRSISKCEAMLAYVDFLLELIDNVLCFAAVVESRIEGPNHSWDVSVDLVNGCSVPADLDFNFPSPVVQSLHPVDEVATALFQLCLQSLVLHVQNFDIVVRLDEFLLEVLNINSPLGNGVIGIADSVSQGFYFSGDGLQNGALAVDFPLQLGDIHVQIGNEVERFSLQSLELLDVVVESLVVVGSFDKLSNKLVFPLVSRSILPCCNS